MISLRLFRTRSFKKRNFDYSRFTFFSCSGDMLSVTPAPVDTAAVPATRVDNSGSRCRRMVVVSGCALVGLFASFLLLLRSSTTFTSSTTASSSTDGLSSVPNAQKRLPQCIIIGARKCGTRALLEFINIHPQVRIASEEVHFFDEDARYARGLSWYRSQMPKSLPGQITVEKSPRYFIDELAPSRIRAMNASVKLVLILRDPVTRTVSDFTQILNNRRRRGKRVKRFGRLVIDPDTKEINSDLRMVTTSMYVRHLKNWYRFFDRSQIHIVDGDELVRDPYSELKLVERFLGLKPFLKRDHFVFNATKGFYCARRETGTFCLNNGKGRPHPNVSKRILRKLRLFFKQANKDLYNLTGRRLTSML